MSLLGFFAHGVSVMTDDLGAAVNGGPMIMLLLVVSGVSCFKGAFSTGNAPCDGVDGPGFGVEQAAAFSFSFLLQASKAGYLRGDFSLDGPGSGEQCLVLLPFSGESALDGPGFGDVEKWLVFLSCLGALWSLVVCGRGAVLYGELLFFLLVGEGFLLLL